MRYTIVGASVGIVAVLCGAVWMRYQDARAWKDADGKPNTSLLGPSFGSVGQDGVVSFDGVVAEVKPNGFVVVKEPSNHPPMLVGAINPEGGVAGLVVGDSVRIEVRLYKAELEEVNQKKIFVVTKRLEK